MMWAHFGNAFRADFPTRTCSDHTVLAAASRVRQSETYFCPLQWELSIGIVVLPLQWALSIGMVVLLVCYTAEACSSFRLLLLCLMRIMMIDA
jgi:hypothetical protein